MKRRIRGLIFGFAILLSVTQLGCVMAPTRGLTNRIDNLPMYGQPDIERPDFLKKADEDFVRSVMTKFESRREASKRWHLQGERYMNGSNFDYAMRRYNQAWLLDPDYYGSYWGFGRVLHAVGRYEEALRHLEKAKTLVDDDYQNVALLGDLGWVYSMYALSLPDSQASEKARLLQLGNQYFSESTTLDPTYGWSWDHWARSLIDAGNYAAAWEKVKLGREHNAPPLPRDFLRRLTVAMPEPE